MNPEHEDRLFYYCNDGETVEGPHTWEQLLELLGNGLISPATAICEAGSEVWVAFGSLLPAEEQGPAERADDMAEEVCETFGDTVPVPTAARRRIAFGLTPKLWASVAGAVALVAILASSGLRFVNRPNGKAAATDAAKPAGTASGATDIQQTQAAAGPGSAWEWAIRPRFQEALPFGSDSLALVRLAEKWGMIDKSGKEVLACRFDEIQHFPEEKCAGVRLGNKWGLADAGGKVVLSPEWDEVGPLVRGFIPVKRDGKWGYATASGKLAIRPAWNDAWRFSPAGTAVVTIGEKRGFIDKTGRVITPLEWDGAINHVAEGVGAVRRGDGWALVDQTGRVLCEPEWGMQWRFLRADLGFLPVWKDGKWGILGLDGKVIVPPEWTQMAPAKNGMLLARPGTPAIFIGAGGKVLFETGPWDEVSGTETDCSWGWPPQGFSEGRLAVRSGGKWGFIDEQGAIAIQPTWDKVGEFSEGLVAVQNSTDSNVWQFLKPDGTPAFPGGNNSGLIFRDSRAPRFRNGLVKAWSPQKRFSVWLDREGNDKSAEGDEHPSWLPEGVAIKGTDIQHISRHGRDGYMRNFVGPDGKTLMRDVPVELASLADPFPYPGPPRYGLAGTDGKVLVEPSWDWAEFIAPGWLRIWVDDRAGLVNREGKTVLAPEWDEVEVTDNGLLLARKDGEVSVFDAHGKDLLPKQQLPGAEYVDFYGKGFVAESRRPDGSTLWSLCDPSAGAPVSYANAERVYWTGDMADNGLLWIEERDTGQWSLVKRDGTPLGIRQAAKPDGWFMCEGFGILTSDDGKQVHVSPAGQVLGSVHWERACQFSNGLAAVKSGGKWGVVDAAGRLVIPAEWDEVGDFKNGASKDAPVLMADVRRGRLWGSINSEGQVVVEPFSERRCQNFSSGVLTYYVKAEGERREQRVRFNSDGSILLKDPPPGDREEPQAEPMEDGLAIGYSNGKATLCDHEGKPLLDSTWDRIERVAPGVVAAWNKNDGGIFDAKGQVLFRDNPARRIARFDEEPHDCPSDLFRQGLVLIEATPVWGYAHLRAAGKLEKMPTQK